MSDTCAKRKGPYRKERKKRLKRFREFYDTVCEGIEKIHEAQGKLRKAVDETFDRKIIPTKEVYLFLKEFAEDVDGLEFSAEYPDQPEYRKFL